MMLVTLCGLQAHSPAQVHVGLSFGKGVAVRASVGPVVFASGLSHCATYQPVACAPIVRHAYRAPRRHVVERRVWVPGSYELVEVPAQYRTTYDHCGRPVRTLICAAYTKRVFRPGHWESVSRRTGRYR
jgi:hypothetical protein